MTSKEWRIKNKDRVYASNKKYAIKNQDKLKEKRKEYIVKNKVNIAEYAKTYYEKNKIALKKSITLREKEYLKNPQYLIAKRLRSRIKNAIKHHQKVGSAVKDLGCSIEYLKSYLESKFSEGMNWNNHGQYGWHIDHIIPLASFDLTNREEFLKACHYTNLQPLWWKDNLIKGKSMMEMAND